jgi:hypothetical protein
MSGAGLWFTRSDEEKHMPAPTTRQLLNRDAIRALFWIIITALLGIIVTTLAGVMLRAGIFNNDTTIEVGAGDEALSILGNVASAAIGGLVGWLTRDYAESSGTNGTQALPPLISPSDIPSPPTPAIVPATATTTQEEPVADEPIVDDHPSKLDINPPEPVQAADGSVEYPGDPNFTPEPIPEQDLTPAEADDDYNPSGEDKG